MSFDNPNLKGSQPNEASQRRFCCDLDFENLDLEIFPPPDLTRRIMGRLGYMRVSARVSRRFRIRRWAGRAGTVMASAIVLGIGWRAYENSSAIRRPVELTIPAAIGNDLQRQQDRLGNVINLIRNISIPPRNMNNDSSAPTEPEAPPVMDDVNQSPHLPYRWV